MNCVRPAWARTYGVQVPCGSTNLDSSVVSKDNHEPKARARPRGIVRRKPECKRCEATDRNRIVKAEGCEASWHMTAKPTGTQPTVNAALVHRQFAFLPGEICAGLRRGADGLTRPWWCRTRNDPARDRAARSDCERTGSDPSVRAARRAATRGVTVQKSANAIVGRRESGGRRAEQRDTRSST